MKVIVQVRDPERFDDKNIKGRLILNRLIHIFINTFRSSGGLSLLAGLLLLQTLLFSACSASVASGNARGTQTPEGVPVNVAIVTEKAMPVQTKAIGNIEAYSTVQIKARVEGELTKVYFNEDRS